jgi:glycosyltransferase involved in cell wall biosynthesis
MPSPLEVLHYTGGDDDRGGVISVVRNLASTGAFQCILGVNPGCVQYRVPALATLELPRIVGEEISPRNFWRARAVARAVQSWLKAGPNRIYHGHSRAGMLVGLWLQWRGEKRVFVSVHCYGRQRWFYRWASRRLEGRLYWLSPAMKEYYRVGDDSWAQCVPGCIAAAPPVDAPQSPPAGIICLGGVGALARWKNWELVLKALALLPGELRARFRFRHIGSEDGSPDSRAYAAGLHATAAKLGFPGQVQWLGQQASSAAFLAETHCLIVASHNEPFSIAMLEALQNGKPVLASDSGGARDIIGAGQNGWLFRSGDAGDLSRQLELLAGPESWSRLRIDRAGLQRFTAPVVAAEWAKIYLRS